MKKQTQTQTPTQKPKAPTAPTAPAPAQTQKPKAKAPTAQAEKKAVQPKAPAQTQKSSKSKSQVEVGLKLDVEALKSTFQTFSNAVPLKLSKSETLTFDFRYLTSFVKPGQLGVAVPLNHWRALHLAKNNTPVNPKPNTVEKNKVFFEKHKTKISESAKLDWATYYQHTKFKYLVLLNKKYLVFKKSGNNPIVVLNLTLLNKLKPSDKVEVPKVNFDK